ncbi:MAG TPA: MFS transporter, partial [Spirochaetia bacterium]|nr:MFS transporter [Spirochaetia bacterium]
MPTTDYRRNFWVLTADGMFFFLGMIFISFESVLPVFLARLGAPRVAIALVPVAVALGVNMPSIFAVSRIEAARSKRSYVLRNAVWQRIPWGVVALATPLLALGNSGWLVAIILTATLVATVAGGFVIPAFFDIVASTVPVEKRGTLFAMRSVLSYLFGIGGGIVVRVVLDRLAFPGNFALLYAIATLVLFAGMLAFSFIRVPEKAAEEPAVQRAKSMPIGQRIRNVLGGNPNFRWYIAARGLLILAFATTSFFPVYLVEEFGLPDS